MNGCPTIGEWLALCQVRHRLVLDNDPEFKHWLEAEYRPIAGGWQY